MNNRLDKTFNDLMKMDRLFDDFSNTRLSPISHQPDTFWNILDHKESFPFISLTSTTNGARNFPPYNMVEQEDGDVRLELAVAGYTKEQLTVEKEENILIIKGAGCVSTETIRHKGISSAAWLRTFDLQEKADIKSVVFTNGILKIVVSIPKPIENTKPRTTFEIK
jgi:molecular chaperone IbpA